MSNIIIAAVISILFLVSLIEAFMNSKKKKNKCENCNGCINRIL